MTKQNICRNSFLMVELEVKLFTRTVPVRYFHRQLFHHNHMTITSILPSAIEIYLFYQNVVIQPM